jgi:hypothetical protein
MYDGLFVQDHSSTECKLNRMTWELQLWCKRMVGRSCRGTPSMRGIELSEIIVFTGCAVKNDHMVVVNGILLALITCTLALSIFTYWTSFVFLLPCESVVYIILFIETDCTTWWGLDTTTDDCTSFCTSKRAWNNTMVNKFYIDLLINSHLRRIIKTYSLFSSQTVLSEDLVIGFKTLLQHSEHFMIQWTWEPVSPFTRWPWYYRP